MSVLARTDFPLASWHGFISSGNSRQHRRHSLADRWLRDDARSRTAASTASNSCQCNTGAAAA